jgi:sugar O-acyltransferase (sialic acid O-acetyltransferase NeuD family)
VDQVVSLPFIIVGASGHAKVLADALQRQNEQVLGFVDPREDLWGLQILGAPVLGGDEVALDRAPSTIHMANGIGSIKSVAKRKRAYEWYVQKGYDFPAVIHPSSVVGGQVTIGKGVQLMAGSVVQAGTMLCDDVIVNTNASVDHDCWLEEHVHVAPGAILSGGVRVGRGTHIGVGAVVIQGITIGSDCIVAAGAVVIRDICSGAKVGGVPAKDLSR